MIENYDTACDLIIIGAGKMADVITAYLDRFTDYNIVAYVVDREYFSEGLLCNGKPVIAWDSMVDQYPPGQVKLLGPVTYQKINKIRKDKYLAGKALGYEFASFIHPAAHIMSDRIGEHVIIMEQAVVQPFVEIGNNTIIWSDTHLGHHTKIGDHCFLSAFVGLSGGVTVGNECYLSGQVGVVQERVIGDRCVLLNRAVVGRNLPDDTVAADKESEIKPFPSSRISRLL